MKKAWIGFFVCFAAGYAVFAWRDDGSLPFHKVTEYPMGNRESSARSADIVDVYQDLMMNDEQKFQLALAKANRLPDLLGLAEKLHQDPIPNNSFLGLLTDKIARLCPEDALNYYGLCPTDPMMNQVMYRAILSTWSDLDFKACIAYLNGKPPMFGSSFYDHWGAIADYRYKSHPQDCIDVFQGFSAELQRELMKNSYMDEKLYDVLLPLLKDQEFVAQLKVELAKKEQNEELRRQKISNRIDADRQKSLEQPPSKIEDWKDSWENEWPEPKTIVSAIRSLPSLKERRDLLAWATKPRGSWNQAPVETPEVWLERIEPLLRDVKEVPTSLIEMPQFGHQPFRNVLAGWLPQQSPALQRAWAESVVRFQEPQEAFAWIEQLGTASLRHDMRALAWERWTSNKAKDAAAAMMEQATPEEREMHLPDAVHGWAVWDYVAAKKWLDAQPDSEAKSQALQKIESK